MNITNNCSTNVALNITFKDESDLTPINGTIKPIDFDFVSADSYNYIHQENSELPYHTYCLEGPTYLDNSSLSISATGTIKYDATGYPLRTHYFSDSLTGNNATELILYLLNSDDGIYSSIQVQTTTGTAISDATIIVERQFEGVWTEIGRGNTDASGMVTFWVNPNYEHRYTVSADGYQTSIVAITPSQDTYTIQLTATGTDIIEYDSGSENVEFRVFPSIGPIETGLYNFGYEVSSDESNLRGCRAILKYSNGTEINRTTSCENSATYSGDTISIPYTVQSGDRLNLELWLKILSSCSDNVCSVGPRSGEVCNDNNDCTVWGVIDSDARFEEFNVTADSSTGLRGVFTDLNSWKGFGPSESVEQEWSKTIGVFLTLFILLGTLSYFTRIDSQWPGFFLILLWGLVLFLSMAGFFEYSITESSFLNQYTLAIIVSSLFIGWGFNTWGRYG